MVDIGQTESDFEAFVATLPKPDPEKVLAKN